MEDRENIRREAIDYSFLQNDRIWPPTIAFNRNHPFMKAVLTVLERLPDDAYYAVEDYVSFVVEDPRIIAINAIFKRFYPGGNQDREIRFDTIVVFHSALCLSHDGLVGLLAHELAHSLVTAPDYEGDEKSADKLVGEWGFGKEFSTTHTDLKRLAPDAALK